MMFSAKFLSVAIAALAVPVFAAPAANGGGGQCNTGAVQCCNSVQTANSSPVQLLTGLLGIVLGPLTGNVGLGCNPITILGIGSGSNCAAQPVCCEQNQFNGLINLGCSPINISL